MQVLKPGEGLNVQSPPAAQRSLLLRRDGKRAGSPFTIASSGAAFRLPMGSRG